jgi:hypothetical protein
MIGGAMNGVALSPLLPWPLLAALFAAAGVAVLLALVKGARGALWRAAGFLILAALLLNPAWVEERRQAIKDVAIIVADDSPSQNIGERAARRDAAVARLSAEAAAMPDMEVRVVRAAGEGDKGLDETRLFDAWSRAVADLPRGRLAGTILITDGQVHDVPRDFSAFAAAGPVHALITGRRDEIDRRLTVVQAPTFGLAGKTVELTVRVEDRLGTKKPAAAGSAGAETLLTVRVDGGAPRTVRATAGRDLRLEVPLTHAGQNVVELSVPPLDGEITQVNNRAAVVVNGVRDRLRVLLVSGEPHAGERTWRNLLKADPAVDLVHFTILRPPEKQDGTPIRELSLIAFPIRELFEVKLDEFDLIIFDRYRRAGVLPQTYLENIARYVENGGALLEASGLGFAGPLSLYQAGLGAALPAEPTGRVLTGPFRPTVTDLGRRHPVTAGLPGDRPGGEPVWGRWFNQVEIRPRAGSVVMTGAEGKPLLVLNRVGRGRAAQLASDQVWLWSRGYEGGGPQAELLRRLAHWLMKEPELEENDLRARSDGRRLTVERRMLDAAPPAPLTMTAPDGTKTPLPLAERSPGLWTAEVVAAAPGIYGFSDGTRTALAAAGSINPPELADPRATTERLQPLIDATGGGAAWLTDGDVALRRVAPDRAAAGSGWLGLRANDNHVVTGLTRTPLAPPLAALVLALAALMTAWRREGR